FGLRQSTTSLRGLFLGSFSGKYSISSKCKIAFFKLNLFSKYMEYTRLLAKNKDVTLEEIIMLDKVQKKNPLTEDEEKHLKNKKLIEGRKPNYYIGLKVASKTGQKAAYSKNKAFDKSYYLDLILKSIREHSSLERKDIDELLWNKLPDWMARR